MPHPSQQQHGTVLGGLTTRVATARLARSLQLVLADDARRIRYEASLEIRDIIRSQLTAPHAIVPIMCAAACACAAALTVSSGGTYGSNIYGDVAADAGAGAIVATAVIIICVAANVAIVLVRAHRLRWETHDRIATALLEFERASGMHARSTSSPQQSHRVAVQTEREGSTNAATVVTSDGIVVEASNAWRVLDFHDLTKSVHTVVTLRDGEWVRLPVHLLVKGDFIALMAGEMAPAKIKGVDGVEAGRRSSVSGIVSRTAAPSRTSGANSSSVPTVRTASPAFARGAISGSTVETALAPVAAVAPSSPLQLSAVHVPLPADVIRAPTTGGHSDSEKPTMPHVAAPAIAPAAAPSDLANGANSERTAHTVGGQSERTRHHHHHRHHHTRAAPISGEAMQGREPSVGPGRAQSAGPVPVRTPTTTRDRAVDALTLCGDARRFILLDTPAIAALRKRLRAPLRPQSLLITNVRSATRLFGIWAAVLAAVSFVAVFLRSLLTNTIPWAWSGGVQPTVGSNGDTRVGYGATVGVLSGLFVQLPTLVLLLTPLTLPALLSCAELYGTARMLATHEAAIVRSRWKKWRREILLQQLATRRSGGDGTTAAAVPLRREAVSTAAIAAAGIHGDGATTLAHTNLRTLTAVSGRWLSTMRSQFQALACIKRSRAGRNDRVAAAAAQTRSGAPLLSGSGDVAPGELPFISEGDAGPGDDAGSPSLSIQHPVQQHVGATAPWSDPNSRESYDAAQASHVTTSAGRIAASCCACSARYRCPTHVVDRLRNWSRHRWWMSCAPRGGRFTSRRDSDDEGSYADHKRVEDDTDDEEDVAMLSVVRAAAAAAARLRAESNSTGIDDDGVQRASASQLQRSQHPGGIGSSQAQRKVMLESVRTLRPDVGDVSERGDLVPLQYVTAREVLKMQHARRWCCIRARHQSKDVANPRVVSTSSPPRRTFDGSSFEDISAGHATVTPAHARVAFYAWRLMRSVSAESRSEDKAARAATAWSNQCLMNDLIDVGFGVQPIPVPLLSSQALFRLAGHTVFACADRSTVTDPHPVVESVMLLKGEAGSAIIDLHSDDASPSGIRFDDGGWHRHIQSLKPVALACLLNSRVVASTVPPASATRATPSAGDVTVTRGEVSQSTDASGVPLATVENHTAKVHAATESPQNEPGKHRSRTKKRGGRSSDRRRNDDRSNSISSNSDGSSSPSTSQHGDGSKRRSRRHRGGSRRLSSKQRDERRRAKPTDAAATMAAAAPAKNASLHAAPLQVVVASHQATPTSRLRAFLPSILRGGSSRVVAPSATPIAATSDGAASTATKSAPAVAVDTPSGDSNAALLPPIPAASPFSRVSALRPLGFGRLQRSATATNSLMALNAAAGHQDGDTSTPIIRSAITIFAKTSEALPSLRTGTGESSFHVGMEHGDALVATGNPVTSTPLEVKSVVRRHSSAGTSTGVSRGAFDDDIEGGVTLVSTGLPVDSSSSALPTDLSATVAVGPHMSESHTTTEPANVLSHVPVSLAGHKQGSSGAFFSKLFKRESSGTAVLSSTVATAAAATPLQVTGRQHDARTSIARAAGQMTLVTRGSPRGFAPEGVVAAGPPAAATRGRAGSGGGAFIVPSLLRIFGSGTPTSPAASTLRHSVASEALPESGIVLGVGSKVVLSKDTSGTTAPVVRKRVRIQSHHRSLSSKSSSGLQSSLSSSQSTVSSISRSSRSSSASSYSGSTSGTHSSDGSSRSSSTADDAASLYSFNDDGVDGDDVETPIGEEDIDDEDASAEDDVSSDVSTDSSVRARRRRWHARGRSNHMLLDTRTGRVRGGAYAYDGSAQSRRGAEGPSNPAHLSHRNHASHGHLSHRRKSDRRRSRHRARKQALAPTHEADEREDTAAARSIPSVSPTSSRSVPDGTHGSVSTICAEAGDRELVPGFGIDVTTRSDAESRSRRIATDAPRALSHAAGSMRGVGGAGGAGESLLAMALRNRHLAHISTLPILTGGCDYDAMTSVTATTAAATPTPNALAFRNVEVVAPVIADGAESGIAEHLAVVDGLRDVCNSPDSLIHEHFPFLAGVDDHSLGTDVGGQGMTSPGSAGAQLRQPLQRQQHQEDTPSPTNTQVSTPPVVPGILPAQTITSERRSERSASNARHIAPRHVKRDNGGGGSPVSPSNMPTADARTRRHGTSHASSAPHALAAGTRSVVDWMARSRARLYADDEASLLALAAAVKRIPPRSYLVPLALEMGFTPNDVAIFEHVRHIYTIVVGAGASASSSAVSRGAAVTSVRNKMKPLPLPAQAVSRGDVVAHHSGGKRTRNTVATSASSQVVTVPNGDATVTSECLPVDSLVPVPVGTVHSDETRVLLPTSRDAPWIKPALTATVVRDTRTGRLQMLSQGNLPYVLANCAEYWDGSTIWPLTTGRRNALLGMYQQWRSEDLFCVGVAYDPVSVQEAALFAAMDDSLRAAAALAVDASGATPVTPTGTPVPDATSHAADVTAHAAAVADATATGHVSTIPLPISADSSRTPPGGLHPSAIGLGFDSGHVHLLARAGELRLNAQLDARGELLSRRGGGLQAWTGAAVSGAVRPAQHAREQQEPVSDGATTADACRPLLLEPQVSQTLARVTSDGTASAPTSAETTSSTNPTATALAEARLLRMQSGQVFAGLIGARYQPAAKVQQLIKDLDAAGVRFVYFASRNYRRVRPLAQKMGLETGWNCAISLMPRARSSAAATTVTGTSAPVARHYPASTAADRGALGVFEVEEDEEDFGVEGVVTDERRWRAMRSQVDEQIWDHKAQLPHGVPEIRSHLRDVDNVPLLVSLFTDSSPPAIAGMMRVQQEMGEVVLIIASPLRKSSPLLYAVGDVAIALLAPPPPPPPRIVTLGKDAEAGSDDDGGKSLAVATHGKVALPLTPQHPQVRLANALASVHCALTVPAGVGLHLLLKAVADARRAVAATQQCLAYAAHAHTGLAMLVLVNIATAAPVLLAPHHALWFILVIIPILAVSLLTAAPEDRAAVRGARMPGKRADIITPLWDVIPGPAAPLPVASMVQPHIAPVDHIGVGSPDMPLPNVSSSAISAGLSMRNLAATTGLQVRPSRTTKRSADDLLPELVTAMIDIPAIVQHADNLTNASSASDQLLSTDASVKPTSQINAVSHVEINADELYSGAEPYILDVYGDTADMDEAAKTSDADNMAHSGDPVDLPFGNDGVDEKSRSERRPVVYAEEGDDEVHVESVATAMKKAVARDDDFDAVNGEVTLPAMGLSLEVGDMSMMQSVRDALRVGALQADDEVLLPIGEFQKSSVDNVSPMECYDIDNSTPADEHALVSSTSGRNGMTAHRDDVQFADVIDMARAGAPQVVGCERTAAVTDGGVAMEVDVPLPPLYPSDGADEGAPSGVDDAAMDANGSTPVTQTRTAVSFASTVPAFNPVTGGVHAESLIRYGAYHDATAAVAGHNVEISTAAAAKADGLLRDAAAAGGVALSASAAARAVSFTFGIAPAQGLLAAPPMPKLPHSWRRFTLYVLAVAVPTAIFHEYVFERALVTGLAADGVMFASTPATIAYPFILPLATGMEAAVRRRIAWAQGLTLLSLTLTLALASAHFVYRSHPIWIQYPTRASAWAPAVALVILLQFAHSHALTAAVGAESPLLGVPSDLWGALAAWQIVACALLIAIKAHDARRFEHAMVSLRAYFDTRLGMWSPR